jgi:hypothetical protein
MKLTHIALALAALVSAQAGHAATAVLTGASAFSVNQARALKNICSGTYTLYKSSSSTSALTNDFTATCSVNFTGTAIDQVRVNVSAGSYGAVVHATVNGNLTQRFIDPASAACVAAVPFAGTGGLSFATAIRNCAGTVNQTSEGGFLDVEGAIFRGIGTVSIPGGVADAVDFIPSNFLQAFGVGVSESLYRSLMAYQVAKGQLPSTCATTSQAGNPVVTTYTALLTTDASYSLPACQPSLSRAAVTAMMEANYNDSKEAGANAFFGGTGGTTPPPVANDLTSTQAISPAVPLGTTIKFCRRVDTSGTNAAMQTYFLTNPTASGEAGGRLPIAGSGVTNGDSDNYGGSTYLVVANGGTSDVRTCLNSGLAFGILSLENNPIGGQTYRFVKVNNQFGADGVAGAAQTAEAIAGRYDFTFEAFKYCPGGTCSDLINAIDGGVSPGQSSPGVYLKAESRFTRNGNNQSPLSTKPRELP